MKVLFRFDIIANYIRKNGYTKRTFCKKCGIEIEEFDKMQTGDLTFKFETLVRITNFMNIDMFDYFIQYPVPMDYD